MSIWSVVIWPIMLGDATWQRWKLVVLQTWTPLQKQQKLPTSLQCFYSYYTSRGPEKMILFLSCNAIFNKNSRTTIRFLPRGPFFVAVLHVFTSDRLFERLLLVWKQVLQLPCRLWWRRHMQLGCSDWDPYNSQLIEVWPRSREKPCLESNSIWDWRLCFLAVFFFGFNGWQVGSVCPGSCGHLWSLWGWHYSGNTSCATDSGCSCEADELACQDPVMDTNRPSLLMMRR